MQNRDEHTTFSGYLFSAILCKQACSIVAHETNIEFEALEGTEMNFRKKIQISFYEEFFCVIQWSNWNHSTIGSEEERQTAHKISNFETLTKISQKNNKHFWSELTKRYKLLWLVKMKWMFRNIFLGYFCPSKELNSNSKLHRAGRAARTLAIHGRFHDSVPRSRISFHHHIKFDFYFLLVGNNVSTQLPANSSHKNDFNILEKSLVVTTERKTWGGMHDPRILTISLTTICVQVNYVMRLMLKNFMRFPLLFPSPLHETQSRIFSGCAFSHRFVVEKSSRSLKLNILHEK